MGRDHDENLFAQVLDKLDCGFFMGRNDEPISQLFYGFSHVRDKMR